MPDLRLQKQSRGNVGDGADGNDVERVFKGCGHGPFDQIISSIAPDRRPIGREPLS